MKPTWPGGSGVDFWSFGRSFGESWGGLGGSWVPLRASWEALGVSGGRLGSVFGRLGRHGSLRVVFRARAVLRTPSFGESKGGQDGAKIAPKTDPNRRQKRSRKKMLLKTVLERSWADLGLFWVSSWRAKTV